MYHNIYMVSAEDVQRKALFIVCFVRRAIVPLFLICIDVTYILLNILVRLLLVVAIACSLHSVVCRVIVYVPSQLGRGSCCISDICVDFTVYCWVKRLVASSGLPYYSLAGVYRVLNFLIECAWPLLCLKKQADFVFICQRNR